jgi:F-type H+-transporting ATPase subunit gamma
MPSLKEVRTRITSVSSTQQITSAMKMVSAAKLKRAQDAITQMRPYANKLRDILENVSASLDGSEGPYSKVRTVKSVLLVVITSNRGLCGGFNANIIKRANKLAKNEFAGKQISVLCIGKKGGDYFKKTEHRIIGSDMPRKVNELYDKLTYDNVAPVAEKVMEAFLKGQFDQVVLVYNQFKNAASQIVTAEPFLPVSQGSKKPGKSSDYIFEPSKEFIVQDLIPRSLKTQFYKALLDSHAAEHGARMTAMHKATDNARDMLRDLRISYNKARQAAITKEILEIVGGAEALNA